MEDLDAKTKEAQAAGAEMIVPRVDLPGYGSFSVIIVPGGVVQAIWRAA